MPYDKQTEDRALNELMADIKKQPDRIYRDDDAERSSMGVPLGMCLLLLMLALWILLAAG